MSPDRFPLLSPATRSLLVSGRGYRDDGVFGGGHTDVREVCVYETFCLGNDDIPDTILRLYPDLLSPEEKQVLEWCRPQAHEGEDGMYEWKEEYADTVSRIAREITGKRNPECIWLASYDAVRNYYQRRWRCGEGNIKEMTVPEYSCVLSDTGCSGALLAF